MKPHHHTRPNSLFPTPTTLLDETPPLQDWIWSVSLILLFLLGAFCLGYAINLPFFYFGRWVIEYPDSTTHTIKAILYVSLFIGFIVYFVFLFLKKRGKQIITYVKGIVIFSGILLFTVIDFTLAITLPIPINVLYFKEDELPNVLKWVLSFTLLTTFLVYLYLGIKKAFRTLAQANAKASVSQYIALVFPVWLRIVLVLVAIFLGLPWLLDAFYYFPFVSCTILGLIAALVIGIAIKFRVILKSFIIRNSSVF